VVTAMADMSVAVNDSFIIRAVGTDTNGTVVKYLWALDGVNFSDSTDSDSIRTAFDTVGVKTVKMKVRDDDGIESDVDSLRVTVMDASPVNLSPADSEVIDTVLPTLRWMRGLGDTSFTVLLDTLPAPVDTAAAGITDTSFTVAVPLQNGRTYYWQIIGHYAAGDAAGEVWMFTTPDTGPTFTTHPVSQSVTVGDPVSFPVTVTGTGTVSLQWQRSDDDGASWTDIPGDTGNILDFTSQLSDSGAQFRAVATDDAGSTISNVAILSVSALAAPVVPYTSDANTILLDHFDGATSAGITGYVVGSGCSSTAWPSATPSYAYNAGQAGLGQAITLGPPAGQPAGSASYLRYSTADILCSANGTIEFWVYPTAYDLGLASQGQFYNSCGGWTFHMGIDATGHLTAVDWDGSGDWGGGLTSSQVVPLNAWSHVAVTWGSAGVKLYLNSVEVGSYSSTYAPASGYGGYLLMPCGTSAGASCAIDELRISNIQRTTFNVP
jgi:hypothetical protein